MKCSANIGSWGFAAGTCFLICGFVAVFAGCDDVEIEPTENFRITVTPQEVTLTNRGSQVFVASGGLTYTWALEDDADSTSLTGTWAILSAKTGERVTYKSIKSPSRGKALRVLTVSSTLGGDSSNSPGQTASAEAYIFHVP